MSKKEVAGTEVAVAAGGAVGQVLDFAADQGMGMEGADKSSFAIPFISMLQGLSPQIETVDGAKPGLFINNITNELAKELLVVPCAYQRRYIRWAPRSAGGGYKGELSPIDVETGKVPGLTMVNGVYLMDVPAGVTNPFDAKGAPLYDHLADTRNHFILVQSAEGNWQPALLSLSSTQIKKSKRWMSRIQGIEMRDAQGRVFNPPSFSHIYRMKAVKESNDKGEWWGIDINMERAVDNAELYTKAKKFHSDVIAGAVEVSTPPAASDATSGGGEQF
jgi:hypothetical protein